MLSHRVKGFDRGFTLVEIIISILVIGLVTTPVVYFAVHNADLGAVVSEQSRTEGLRSWQDQMMAVGLNPARATGLAAGVNPLVPAAFPVGEGSSPAPSLLMPVTLPIVTKSTTVGAAMLQPMLVTMSGGTAETRPLGAGLELGAGPAIPPPGAPTVPLPPIFMKPPVPTPANGAVVALSSFSATGGGQPYATTVSASVPDGGRVHLSLTNPLSSATGIGSASLQANTVAFAQGESGQAWNEYAGDVAAGDTSVGLADGRTRWYVPVGDQMQPYEPSAYVSFSYKIDIGSPVLVDTTGAEILSGGNTSVDYNTYMLVQVGLNTIRIDWPASTRTAFGGSLSGYGIGFNDTFASVPGPYSGDLSYFFAPAQATLWGSVNTVNATPAGPAGVVASSASWTITQLITKLQPPDKTTLALFGTTYDSGPVEFTVPNLGSLGLIGHLTLTMDSGSPTVSTGPTLTLTILP